MQELRDYLALLPALADELLPHGSPVAGKSIVLLKSMCRLGESNLLHHHHLLQARIAACIGCTASVELAQPAPPLSSSRLACAAANSPCWVRVRGRGEKRREKDRERKQSEPRATLTPHVSRMRQGQYGLYEKCFRIRTPARWATCRCKRT